jgi:hypothetical protein
MISAKKLRTFILSKESVTAGRQSHIYLRIKIKPMQVKKLIPAVLFGMIMISADPIMGSANAVPASTSIPVKGEDPRAAQLMQRLEEIKGMDRSALSRSEKKDLRHEVKGIRKEMKKISGGVYLSAGAIIIVILLLILLL